MIVSYFRLIRAAVSPGSVSDEERPRYARMAAWNLYYGIGILAIAAAVLVWWAVQRQSYGAVPREAIAVEAFSVEDMQGRLQEARVEGVLQFDHMQAWRSAAGWQNNLIPMTGADWKLGDPVPVFIQTHLFLNNQEVQYSGEGFDSGLALMNLPPQSSGATPATLLVKRPDAPEPSPAILDTPEGAAVVAVYVNEEWRARDIGWDTDIHRTLAMALAALGLVFALLGFFTRRAILRYRA